MNDYEVQTFKAYFHYENVPWFMKKLVKKEFMKARNIAAQVFNDNIGNVNQKWDKTGKPASFGEYLEDINPEYVSFIKQRMQPKLDEALKDQPFLRITFDEYGDLIGALKRNENSKIWVTLEAIRT